MSSNEPSRRPRPLLDKHGNPPPPHRVRPQGPSQNEASKDDSSDASVPTTPALESQADVSSRPSKPARPLDKHGNPPPPRSRPSVITARPASLSDPSPTLRRREIQPEAIVDLEGSRSGSRQQKATSEHDAVALPVRSEVSDRRTVPRPAPPARPARAVPRQDPATYQPVYVNEKVATARVALEWIGVIVVAITVALLIKSYVVEAYEIPSGSMEPTLMVHDKVVVNKLTYDYSGINYGDIVVFKRPPGEQDPTIHNLIKRVIGKPGDVLEARDGVLYRNGQPVSEPYLPPGTYTDTLPKTTVPPGEIFFMGDNRGNSYDSRYFGAVSEKLIEGKAEAVGWPLGHLRVF